MIAKDDDSDDVDSWKLARTKSAQLHYVVSVPHKYMDDVSL